MVNCDSPTDRREYNWVMSDRITFDPKIMGGLACIRGMRIPVSMIVSQIAMGASFDDVSREYPDLEKEDTIKR